MRRVSSPQRIHRLGFVALIATVVASIAYFANPDKNGGVPRPIAVATPDRIAASKSVLIVVDVQKDFWIPEVSGSSPDFPANVSHVLTVCRAAGVPVLHVRTAFDPSQQNFPDKFQQTHDELRLCDPGTTGHEPLPCAVAMRNERVFEKANFDPFSLDDFRQAVAETGAENVFICGLYTDVCVLSTAMSAFNSGYRVTVIEDSCASTPAMHEFVIQRFGDFVFESLGHLEFASRIADTAS